MLAPQLGSQYRTKVVDAGTRALRLAGARAAGAA
jgi:hypothetical protein